MIHASENIGGDARKQLLRQRPAALDHRGERAAVHVLEHDVHGVVGVEGILERDDPGHVRLVQGADLHQDLSALLVGTAQVDHFLGVQPTRRLVPNEAHDAARALAELAQHTKLVQRDLLVVLRRGHRLEAALRGGACLGTCGEPLHVEAAPIGRVRLDAQARKAYAEVVRTKRPARREDRCATRRGRLGLRVWVDCERYLFTRGDLLVAWRWLDAFLHVALVSHSAVGEPRARRGY